MTEPGNIRFHQRRLRLGCFTFCPGLHHVGQGAHALLLGLLSQPLTLKPRADVVMGDSQAYLRCTKARVVGHKFRNQTHLQCAMVFGNRFNARICRFNRSARSTKDIQLPTGVKASKPRPRFAADLPGEASLVRRASPAPPPEIVGPKADAV